MVRAQTPGGLRASLVNRLNPKQKARDLTMLVTVDNRGERASKVAKRIDEIELKGIDERSISSQSASLGAPLAPTAISAMSGDSLVCVKGKVAEIFGNKFIIQDPVNARLLKRDEKARAGRSSSKMRTSLSRVASKTAFSMSAISCMRMVRRTRSVSCGQASAWSRARSAQAPHTLMPPCCQ